MSDKIDDDDDDVDDDGESKGGDDGDDDAAGGEIILLMVFHLVCKDQFNSTSTGQVSCASPKENQTMCAFLIWP